MMTRTQEAKVKASSFRKKYDTSLVDIDGNPYTFGDVQLTPRNIYTHLGVSLQSIRLALNSLRRIGIHKPNELYKVGMLDILEVRGIGEAQIWAMCNLLDAHGYSVTAWIERHGTKATDRRAIAARTRKRKARNTSAAA